MGNTRFSGAFKRDAVCQMSERGYPVAEVSQRLGAASIPCPGGARSGWRKKLSQPAASSGQPAWNGLRS